MTTYVVIYEGFVNFEIVLAMYLLKTAGEIKTIAVSDAMVKSAEGLTVKPDGLIGEVTLEEEDVLLIPGGNPEALADMSVLYELIRQGNDVKALLAAICAAPLHLAKAGVLENREYTTSLSPEDYKNFDVDMYVRQNVVVDEHIVTAQPSGYAEFAIVLGQLMDIYNGDDDFQETVRFFMDYEIQ